MAQRSRPSQGKNEYKSPAKIAVSQQTGYNRTGTLRRPAKTQPGLAKLT